MARRVPRRHIRIGRDLVTYTVALAGIVYEVVVVVSQHREADPILLAFLGGLLGLPSFLKRDDGEPPENPPADPPDPNLNGRHRGP